MKRTQNTRMSLKRLLDLRLISQAELAKAVNRTEADISRYVNNHRLPRLAAVRQIAKVLNANASKCGDKILWSPK